MLSSLLSFKRAEWPFIRSVLLPVALVALTTLSMGAIAILWAVNKSNDISAERQLRTTEASIRAAVQELALQQEMVAIWDDAVVELNKSSLDLKWIDANFGVWLNKTFGQDEIYILDERNEPLVATVGNTRVPAEEYERVRADVSDLVAGIRGALDSLHRSHVEELATAAYLKTGQAVHDAHLLELNGRPAAVSVMKIIPESEDVPYPYGKEFLLLSIRFLDGSFITQLSERNLIEGLRFSPPTRPSRVRSRCRSNRMSASSLITSSGILNCREIAFSGRWDRRWLLLLPSSFSCSRLWSVV